MKTLKVKGTGQMKATPDLVTISFKIHEQDKTYEKCSHKMNERINFLYQDIIKAGFQKGDLKTTDFRIETLYESRNFKGYSTSSNFKLKFDFTKEKLNNFLQIVLKSNSNPEFRIAFGIKDKEIFMNKLLESAVADSKKKAELIAKSSGVSLGDIVEIDYSWQKIKIESNSNYSYGFFSSPNLTVEEYDLGPEDVKAEDGITILWEIK